MRWSWRLWPPRGDLGAVPGVRLPVGTADPIRAGEVPPPFGDVAGPPALLWPPSGAELVQRHVTPVGDAVAHRVNVDGGCVCGPRIEMVVVHHALDGREAGE